MGDQKRKMYKEKQIKRQWVYPIVKEITMVAKMQLHRLHDVSQNY